MKTIGWTTSCLLMIAACGGDGGSDNDPVLCESFSACGGDPTGSWTLAGFCIGGEEVTFEECPGATFEIDASRTGTLELDSDNGLRVDVTSVTRSTFTVPGSCLTGGDDCSSLEQDDESLSCNGDPASSCTCTGEDSSVTLTTGNWALSGNRLALTGEDGTETVEFCVDGNTLTLRDGEGAVTRLTR